MTFDPSAATAAYIDGLGPEALAKAAAYTSGGHWLLLWGLGSWWAGRDVSYVTVLTGVLVSTAPQIWGFLVLIPYLGSAIGRLLSAWSAVCLWAVTATTFGLGRWPALLLVGVAWLVMYLLSLFVSPLITRGVAALFQRVFGRQFHVSGADVLNGRPLLTTEVLT